MKRPLYLGVFALLFFLAQASCASAASLLVYGGTAILATPGTQAGSGYVSLSVSDVTAVPYCLAVDNDKMAVVRVTVPILNGTNATFTISGTANDQVTWMCIPQTPPPSRYSFY